MFWRCKEFVTSKLFLQNQEETVELVCHQSLLRFDRDMSPANTSVSDVSSYPAASVIRYSIIY
jgi:hypothetical protein